MRNIRLKVSYDGTMYHGFQRQPEFHGPTIQGTLELVWRKLVGEEVTLNTAGRTDRGVHATGQVVNFLTAAQIPDAKIPKAFNSLLPRDIRILEAQTAPQEFHARFSARWKRYDYRIDNQPISNVFTRLYALHEPIPLRVEEMKLAAHLLEGKHNFKAFSSAGGVSKTFDRNLYVCRIQEDEGLLRITCIGNGFLYNMVRIIAGTLINVGKGWIQAEEIPNILLSLDRKRAGITARARGLTLSYVHYGEESPYEIFPEYLPPMKSDVKNSFSSSKIELR
ncbi:tRNA pseudouridine(38-40) synthase TruA [Desulfitobacterium sp.]|uniref:tRNA pseudouridine(38-40) synthase TruA n=1 Tax=Desulfitobacterium sp. TaxID=49981 RepID=UPI002BBEB20E|nr:tRNA pseudouridine(38-40) synthase TruA [Desulfitobacterium sp.]HVJ48257.1 tRNA pseudouridine(38-40) synthase TruA [Desulfitobacterium sp.]